MKVLSKDDLVALIKLDIWQLFTVEHIENLFDRYGDDYSEAGEFVSKSPNAERRDMLRRLTE